jgi:hypothetical protein
MMEDEAIKNMYARWRKILDITAGDFIKSPDPNYHLIAAILTASSYLDDLCFYLHDIEVRIK